MPDTIAVSEPFVTVADPKESRLVLEVLNQTAVLLPAHSIVQRQASGLFQAAGALTGAQTGLAFALVAGHNYTRAGDQSNVLEVQAGETEIEINLLGTPTEAQLAPGTLYGLSLSGGVYVLDLAKAAANQMQIVGLAGRGEFGLDQVGIGSGRPGDTNPRVRAKFTTASRAF